MTKKTFPNWTGPAANGVAFIMNDIGMDPNQWQPGNQKVFIKTPESLFMLEELRERKYHEIAVTIQRAYRRWKSRKYYLDCRNKSIIHIKKWRFVIIH